MREYLYEYYTVYHTMPPFPPQKLPSFFYLYKRSAR